MTQQPYSTPALYDVFTPCMGYVQQVYGRMDRLGVVTCIPCMTSRFAEQVSHMNLDAIEHLNENDLLYHFGDHEAMALNFEES